MKKIEAKMKVYEVQRGIQAGSSSYTKTIVIFDDSFGEKVSFIPVVFFGNKESEVPENLKKGDLCQVEFFLKGREHNGKYFIDLDGVKCEKTYSGKSEASAPTRDYAAQLNACKDLPQLQSVWMSIPAADKPKFEAAKNAKKEALSDPSFGDDDDNNDDLPF